MHRARLDRFLLSPQLLARSCALGAALACALLAGLVAISLLPSQALAKSYSMTNVDISASVGTDGALSVREVRTFDFDGNYHNVYWEIPLDNASSIQVNGVTMAIEGEAAQPLSRSSSGDLGIYSVDQDTDSVVIRCYFDVEDVSVDFALEYTIEGAAKAWADTGQLQWKPIGEYWEESSNNVTVTLTLPVPAGEDATGGKVVQAWADGPLDGTIDVGDTGTVVFSAPRVDEGQYLAVNVLFPVEWLSQMTPSSLAKYDEILSEMQSEVDEANQLRAQHATVVKVAYIAEIACVVIAIVIIVVFLRTWKRYGRDHQPEFKDKYFRDVPSDDHPAVLGYLWHAGSTGEDLTATYMHLANLGAIKLDRVQTTSRLGKTRDDYLVTLVPEVADAVEDPIDRAALDLLFKSAAEVVDIKGSKIDESKISSDGSSFCFSLVKDFGRMVPETFSEYYDKWSDAVKEKAAEIDTYEPKGELWSGRLKVIGILSAIVASIVFVISMALSVTYGLGALILLLAGLFVGFVGSRLLRRRTLESVNLRAKLGALRNWLHDFTNLKEAIPTDVVLWNRLLVMAVVLGVADRVAKQLKTAMPEVYNAPELAAMMWWYIPYGDARPAYDALSGVIDSAHEKMTEAMSSEFSSSSGDSGGFSGGGYGGGFGGDGGSVGGGGGGAS